MSVEQKLEELQNLAEELALQEAKSEIVPDESDVDSEGKDDNDDDAKPDFVDHDKDGDKKEDFVKAIKDKKASDVKESVVEKIDLGGLFDGQDLSEEFKANATEIFEAAVAVRVAQEVAEVTEALTKSFESTALTESEEMKESLVDKVDGYLDFMVEQWMKENELAVSRGIKTEILESFVAGMKGVFETHYIDVPDEQYDLVEAAQQDAIDLEERLDEEVAKNVKLTSTLKEVNRQIQIEEACEGLAGTDTERFRALAEELSFDDNYVSKLVAIKESYFSTRPVKKAVPLTEEFMTDEPVEIIDESVTSNMDQTMASYVNALNRSVGH
jgi:hypothetical protein